LWYLAHQEPRYGKKRDSIVVDLELGGGQSLAAFLLDSPLDSVFLPDATDKWFAVYVCPTLRPFTSTANKPLHRLRGLYADQLTRETEESILAKRAGLAATQKVLGHTNSLCPLNRSSFPPLQATAAARVSESIAGETRILAA
jgi:hypothetical protein